MEQSYFQIQLDSAIKEAEKLLKQLKNGEYQRDEYRYFVVKAVCQAFQNLDICG